MKAKTNTSDSLIEEIRRKKTMCCKESSKKNRCQNPDRLKGSPVECSPEQVRECHGEVREHPCPPKKQ
ncbi:MAG: hypothetical protein AMS17_08605 [Spirochaetes bacterium DG_61]|nr:MAG: hypothetical protein AMS17_08605 [Spirochaetes bacterium DG_61]